MRPIISSEKHIVQHTLTTAAAGAVTSVLIANATTASAKNLQTEVLIGAVVKAIYVEMWVVTDDATPGSIVWILEKVPANQVSATAAQMASLGTYTNKKNILQSGMGLIGDNAQFPTNLMKGWIKVPKGKQRQGIGDVFRFTILAQTNGINTCGFFIYKEYN